MTLSEGQCGAKQRRPVRRPAGRPAILRAPSGREAAVEMPPFPRRRRRRRLVRRARLRSGRLRRSRLIALQSQHGHRLATNSRFQPVAGPRAGSGEQPFVLQTESLCLAASRTAAGRKTRPQQPASITAKERTRQKFRRSAVNCGHELGRPLILGVESIGAGNVAPCYGQENVYTGSVGRPAGSQGGSCVFACHTRSSSPLSLLERFCSER